jgi:predicted glycoside hydrolase/deacetylase ChbG (UPF0249 family)
MAPKWMLIVNGDDFGMTDGINQGVIEAHTRGIVTSTSLMVKRPKAAAAAALAASQPRLCVGLHVDLTEWEPRDGAWKQMYAHVALDDPEAIAGEIRRQVQIFIELVGREPDHLDSHQHVHMSGAARDECSKVAAALGIPLRGVDAQVYFCNDYYGQRRMAEPYPDGISRANLLSVISAAPPGWIELMCHPGYAAGLDSVYATEREVELAVLTDPTLPDDLRAMGVELRSFAELSSLPGN